MSDQANYEEDDDCPNCGGSGIIYSCWTEYACVDPENGCEECARRCDWCSPRAALNPDTGEKP